MCCVGAVDGGAVWECNLDGLLACLFVHTCCFQEYVMARGSGVEDEAMGVFRWGTVGWMCTVASVRLFLTDRPYLSCLGLSHLAASKIVLSGCFIVVTRLLGAASFAAVACCYEIPVTAAISF
jgi:hypothetical protein